MTTEVPVQKDVKQTIYHSPFGPLYVFHCDNELHALSWEKPDGLTRTEQTTGLLNDCFDGFFQRDFDRYHQLMKQLTFVWPEATPFQQHVWQTLQTIPLGQTWSYGQLAKTLQRPGAARAVGQANRTNPFPLLVPFHRVVQASGKLGGYLGETSPGHNATDLKAALLRHEGAL